MALLQASQQANTTQPQGTPCQTHFNLTQISFSQIYGQIAHTPKELRISAPIISNIDDKKNDWPSCRFKWYCKVRTVILTIASLTSVQLCSSLTKLTFVYTLIITEQTDHYNNFCVVFHFFTKVGSFNQIICIS